MFWRTDETVTKLIDIMQRILPEIANTLEDTETMQTIQDPNKSNHLMNILQKLARQIHLEFAKHSDVFSVLSIHETSFLTS